VIRQRQISHQETLRVDMPPNGGGARAIQVKPLPFAINRVSFCSGLPRATRLTFAIYSALCSTSFPYLATSLAQFVIVKSVPSAVKSEVSPPYSPQTDMYAGDLATLGD
jgi:hypothetical protein